MLLAVSLAVLLAAASCHDGEVHGRNEYTADGWFYRTHAALGQVPSDIPRGAVGIYLNNNNFETIRSTDFRSMTALTFIGLHGNLISEIESGAFTDLSMVTELWLTNNNLFRLRDEMFKGLEDLEELLLSDNSIQTIDRFAFAGLGNLRELFMSSNRLRIIQSGMFGGLGSLEELVLTNNSIDTVQSGAFVGLSNLKKLWLDWNSITEVRYDMFIGLTNLERLALHHNWLTSIIGGIFTGLFRLEILDLDDNRISSIRSDSFRGLDDLKEVWLYNNSLTTLDADSFSGLPRPLALTLGANPLQCGNDLCWLKQGYVTWLSFENRPLLPTCSNGMPWDDLRCPVQVDECPDPGQVENAKRTGTGPFKVRSKVTYTCDFCYAGSKEITCQSNGQWSEKPVCRDVLCPEPGGIQNGRKLSDGPYTCSYLVGYECNEGYMMSGNALLVCRGDETWNSAKPQCVPTPSSHKLPTCKSDLTETRWLIIAIAAGVAGLFVAVICTASCMECCARRRKFKKLKG